MKPIKNFQKLCDVLSVLNLNGERCKFQMYDTTEFWVEPVRKDFYDAKIYPVLFRPDWVNETVTIRVCQPDSMYQSVHGWTDVTHTIPPFATDSPTNWVSWIIDLIFSHQDKIYKRQLI